jgi:hypothetical protein
MSGGANDSRNASDDAAVAPLDDITELIDLLKAFKQRGEQRVVVDPVLKLLEGFSRTRGRPVAAILGDTKCGARARGRAERFATSIVT